MVRDRSDPEFVDLRRFLAVVRARKALIILVAVIVVAIALVSTLRQPPRYASTAQVEVRPQFTQVQTTAVPFANMNTEMVRVTSQSVLEEAAASLGLDVGSPSSLRRLMDRISVSVPANTTYLNITCSADRPAEAQRCAQATADAYRDDRIDSANASYQEARGTPLRQIDEATAQIQTLTEELADTKGDVERQAIQTQINQSQTNIDAARLQLLQIPPPATDPAIIAIPAPLPTEPANRDYVLVGGLALIVGLALGLILAFARERLDERVAVGDHLERALGAPTIAAIPHVPGWRNRNESRTVSITESESLTAEAYRTARTSLLFTVRESGLKVLEITGPGMSEGKTTTTANLAVALSKGGRKVIAVSCDLRKPRLHRFFGIENLPGLSEVLSGAVKLDEALTGGDQLRILPSGQIPGNPGELLGSDAMDDLLARLREEADLVLLDTPPALLVSDALELAPKVDGIIVVADAERSNRGSVAHTRERLERAGGTIIGGILNDLDPTMSRRYRSGYGAYYHRYKYKGAEPTPELNPVLPGPDPDDEEREYGTDLPKDAHEWA